MGQAADAFLETARERAAGAAPQLGLVEYFASWEAAQRGDPATARPYAELALALGGQLGGSVYVPMAQNVIGWSAAMLGDPSRPGRALQAHRDCVREGNRYQETVRLHLCAEAHARHGFVSEARDLVLEARERAATGGERTVGRRLREVARLVLEEPAGPVSPLMTRSPAHGAGSPRPG